MSSERGRERNDWKIDGKFIFLTGKGKRKRERERKNDVCKVENSFMYTCGE